MLKQYILAKCGVGRKKFPNLLWNISRCVDPDVFQEPVHWRGVPDAVLPEAGLAATGGPVQHRDVIHHAPHLHDCVLHGHHPQTHPVQPRGQQHHRSGSNPRRQEPKGQFGVVFGVRVGSVFGDRFWGQFLGTVSGVKPTPPGTKRSVLGSNICGQVPKGQLWGQTFVARNQKVNLGSNTCCKEPKGQFWGQTFVARNQKFSFGVKHLSLGTKRSVLGSVFGLDSRRQGPKGQFWGQLLGPFLGSVLGQTYAARNQKFSFSTRNQKDSFSDNHFFKTSPESNTINLAIVKMNKTGASQVAPLKFFQ